MSRKCFLTALGYIQTYTWTNRQIKSQSVEVKIRPCSAQTRVVGREISFTDKTYECAIYKPTRIVTTVFKAT